MKNKTPMSLLRAAIEEQDIFIGCDTLHELHGDGERDCRGRRCYECKIDALNKAADLVEAELNELKARALPDGVEWPRFEDGEPVRLGDEFECWCGETHTLNSVSIREGRSALNASQPHTFVVSNGPFTAHGKRVKRPAPKVLDADGAEIKVGDEVWSVSGDGPMSVEEIRPSDDPDDPEHIVWCGDKGCELLSDVKIWRIADQLTHRDPVLAADGKPLEVGQTVYVIANGNTHHVTEVDAVSKRFRSMEQVDGSHWLDPMCFTHQRPVLDADGNRVEAGMDVWWVCEDDERGIHAEMLHVDGIDSDGMVECSPCNGGTSVVLDPAELYVKKPLLDADGVPIKVGDTVYFTDGREQECNTVVHAEYDYKDEPYVQFGRLNEAGYPTYTNCSCIDPSQLTHAKPEPPDSWKRLYLDMYNGLIPMNEFMRRCRVLAERGEE